MAAALLLAAVPSTAASSRDVLRVSGTAGTQAVVTLSRAVELERFPADRLAVDRGDVAAVIIVRLGAGAPTWYARHRSSPEFACGGRPGCFTAAAFEDEVTSSDLRPGPSATTPVPQAGVTAASSPSLPGIRLPAGRYAVTVVGEPGARVGVALRARGLGASRTVLTGGPATATVRHLPVVSAGLATWSVADVASRPVRSFEGLVIGVGYGQVSQVDVDACLGTTPAPAATGCAGDGRSFSSNPGDTGDSGLSFSTALNVLSGAGDRLFARATYVEAGVGGGLRAVRYSVDLPA